MTVYRAMKPGDIKAGLSLCRSAGWNQLARDWEIFLSLNPEGCMVAEKEKVIGTVTTVRYQDRFSWIAMVLVDPGFRKQGIGIQLLHQALEILSNEETVKLDATPAGREIYLKLNFIDEYPLTRMILSSSPGKLTDNSVRAMEIQDFPKILDKDQGIFGADRRELLQWILEGGLQYAHVRVDKGDIHGFCFGREGYNFTQLGPVIAENRDIAKNLVLAALNHCLDQPVVMDIPHHDLEWIKWITSIGFSAQRPYTRMFLGKNDYPGIPGKQFAILGPEFG